MPAEEGVVFNPRNQAGECGGDLDGPKAQGVKDAVPSCSEEPRGQEIGYGVAENDEPQGNEQVAGDVAVKGEGDSAAGQQKKLERIEAEPSELGAAVKGVAEHHHPAQERDRGEGEGRDGAGARAVGMSSKLTLPGAETAQGVAQDAAGGAVSRAAGGAVSRAACAAAGHGVHYG